MATSESIDLNAQYQDSEIPLELIDEPDIPERETMEEVDLAELALSIAEQGLIKPLIVRRRANRFVVIAGHRRLLACRITAYSPVPCRIKVGERIDDLAVLVAENAHVEPVNPVGEARFYQRVLVELCGNDVDMLCIKVKRKRAYVEDRLIMLQGFPEVVQALERKQISFAVARELNKSVDPKRLLIWLDVAIVQGASARQVESWRKEAEGQAPIQIAETDPQQLAQDIAEQYQGGALQCWCCESPEDPHMMEVVHLHKYCMRMMERMLKPAIPLNTNGGQ